MAAPEVMGVPPHAPMCAKTAGTAGPGARLHVDFGDDRREGTVGCDLRRRPAADIVCRAREMPAWCRDLAESYSRYLLEHLASGELKATLEDRHRALAPGGVFPTALPNLQFPMARWLRAGWTDIALEDPWSVAGRGAAGCYGWQRDAGPAEKGNGASCRDVHPSSHTEGSSRCFLRRSGGVDVVASIDRDCHLAAVAQRP